MNKCLGCGIELQDQDKNKVGYVDCLTKNLCTRCFRLSNYGEYQEVTLSNSNYQKIIDSIPKNSLIVYVSDILSLNLPVLDKMGQVLLVITKRDILPKSVKDEKIVNYLKKHTSKVLDIILISSKKNYHIDTLYQMFQKYSNHQDIYLVGNTNSGKSTLLNKLISNYGEETTQKITVSMYPSTTLDKVKISLKDLTIIDTPGLLDEINITNYVEKTDLKRITPQKEIKPKSCQLKGKGSILIGNYARINYETKESNSIVIYTSNLVNIQFASLKNETLINQTKFDFSIDKKQDIVIPGLGFIKCTNPIHITIYTLDKVIPYTRDNLI